MSSISNDGRRTKARITLAKIPFSKKLKKMLTDRLNTFFLSDYLCISGAWYRMDMRHGPSDVERQLSGKFQDEVVGENAKKVNTIRM